MTKTNPPQHDEIELSLFGPGVGECIVLHLGGGNWMVVDSCRNESQTITDGMGQIANALLPKDQPIRRFRNLTPNDQSIVLLVRMPERAFLLGSDLDKGKNELYGWQAILASDNFRTKSQVYKVAHHGSENSDLEDLWDNLLQKQPLSVLTPYARGKKPVPSDEDIQRIKKKTDRLYSTVWPPTKKLSGKDNAVARTIREVTQNNFRTRRKGPGHIRLRFSIEEKPDEINVELFDGALKL